MPSESKHSNYKASPVLLLRGQKRPEDGIKRKSRCLDIRTYLGEKEGRASESLLMWGGVHDLTFKGFDCLPVAPLLGSFFEAGSGLAQGQCDNQGWRSLFFQRLFLRFLCFIGGWEEGQ